MDSGTSKENREFLPAVASGTSASFGFSSARVEVDAGGLSDRGLVRSMNEDHFIVVRYGRSLETLATNLSGDPLGGRHQEVGYGFLVADGIGGQAAGEVASRSAIQELIDLVVNTPDWIMNRNANLADIVMQRMAERMLQVNERLLREAAADPRLVGMGTTMTFACSLGLELIVCHIGDSRAYLFREEKLRQLTRDMTMAQELVDVGLLSPAAAATSRLRHYLTQHLGGEGKGIAEVEHLTLQNGDRLLLCSDGLTGMVDDDAIAQVLSASPTPTAACQILVDLALKAGGRDNITVVVAQFRAV